jgi:hypothetical protein
MAGSQGIFRRCAPQLQRTVRPLDVLDYNAGYMQASPIESVFLDAGL